MNFTTDELQRLHAALPPRKEFLDVAMNLSWEERAFIWAVYENLPSVLKEVDDLRKRVDEQSTIFLGMLAEEKRRLLTAESRLRHITALSHGLANLLSTAAEQHLTALEESK